MGPALIRAFNWNHSREIRVKCSIGGDKILYEKNSWFLESNYEWMKVMTIKSRNGHSLHWMAEGDTRDRKGTADDAWRIHWARNFPFNTSALCQLTSDTRTLGPQECVTGPPPALLSSHCWPVDGNWVKILSTKPLRTWKWWRIYGQLAPPVVRRVDPRSLWNLKIHLGENCSLMNNWIIVLEIFFSQKLYWDWKKI